MPVNTFNPYDTDLAAINRKRELANALLQKSLQGDPNMNTPVGGHVTRKSILGPLAQVFQAYIAKKQMGEADTEQKALGESYQQKLADALAQSQTAMKGAPETQTPFQADTFDAQDQPFGSMATVNPAQAPDPQKAAMALLNSGHPVGQQLGQKLLEGTFKQQEPKKPIVLGKTLVDPDNYKPIAVDETWAADQAAARAQKINELNMKLEDQRLSREENAALRRELAAQQEALRRDLATQASADRRAMVRASSGNPYYTPVQTAQGVMAFNARTGKMEPVNVGGAPIIGAGADPVLQGKIAGAKAGESEKAEHEAKRDSNMSGIGTIIDEARTVLKQNPTQSTIGTLVDAAGKIVRATPRGATEAEKLRVIGGALVAKMPRMEGPQSNYDVQYYKEMAGMVGDSTVPVPRRLAALDEVEKLWRKYDKNDAPKTPALPGGWSVKER